MVMVVDGDAVEALAKRDIDILGHQVNLQGIMSAGIAKQIVRTWPRVYKPYKKALRNKTLVLGQVQFVEIASGKWVANIASQTPQVFLKGSKTEYQALREGLNTMAGFMRECSLVGGLPYGIGCGIGGGDWKVVREIILETFQNVDIVLYKLSN